MLNIPYHQDILLAKAGVYTMSEQIFTNCTVGGPISVYVRDGEIVRVRPIQIDESDLKPWQIESKGKKFSPPKKIRLAPYILTERTRVYSDERI